MTPKTLRQFNQALQVGEPISHQNLTLVPLQGKRRGHLDYLLSVDALPSGDLTITEVSEAASVTELLANNQSQEMVMLLDGEGLVGAKQDRILNISVLLPAQSTTRIPVSCVEKGRWRYVSQEFSCGNYSPPRLRARKAKDVNRSLVTAGVRHSNPYTVWNEVDASISEAAVESPTMAMNDIAEQQRDSLADFEALKYPAGARGVMAAIGGKFVALDLFDNPATLERIWGRLINGYAVGAIVDQLLPRKGKPFTAKGATALLEHISDLEHRVFSTIGLGEDWRFEAEDVVGQALVADGECVHLCVFPNAQEK